MESFAGKYITEERLKPYLAVTDNDFDLSIELYLLYMRINESLYFPLQNIELIIRNSFYKIIANKYGKDWIFEKKYLLYGLSGKKDLLEKQLDLLYHKNKSIKNINDVISNVQFGFWLVFLDDDFEVTIWRPCLRKLFVKYDNKVLRSNIRDRLKFIKSIRNRVFHHETLLRYNLMDSYKEIIYFISLISDEFSKWTEKYSTFMNSYGNLENFIETNGLELKNLGNL